MVTKMASLAGRFLMYHLQGASSRPLEVWIILHSSMCSTLALAMLIFTESYLLCMYATGGPAISRWCSTTKLAGELNLVSLVMLGNLCHKCMNKLLDCRIDPILAKEINVWEW